jgi:hypothetical protein
MTLRSTTIVSESNGCYTVKASAFDKKIFRDENISRDDDGLKPAIRFIQLD